MDSNNLTPLRKGGGRSIILIFHAVTKGKVPIFLVYFITTGTLNQKTNSDNRVDADNCW